MIHALFLEETSLWCWAWQSTLFVVIGLVGSFLLRRRPARACQTLFLALVAAVIVPVMSVLVSHLGLGLFAAEPMGYEPQVSYDVVAIDHEFPEAAPPLVTGTDVEPVEPQVDAAPVPPVPVKAVSDGAGLPWRLVLLYGWLIAALILLGRLLIALAGGVHLLRRSKPHDSEQIRRAMERAQARLGITKDLRIHAGEHIRSPMIWCWSRPPVLLVPAGLNGSVDWVDVICHELAHWRRRDHVTGLITELAVCILPWNLLLWWARKRIVRLGEQACDDWVLAGGRAGTDYAQSLLNLSPKAQMAFLPTMIGKEKPMKERICRIVRARCGNPRVGVRWALAMTVVAATLTVGVAFAQRRPAPEESDRQARAEHRADLQEKAHQMEMSIG
ncbi:MAG: M56 family metallopeptidase [Sedimentisphaerales bacterium]